MVVFILNNKMLIIACMHTCTLTISIQFFLSFFSFFFLYHGNEAGSLFPATCSNSYLEKTCI